jgi:hypothetical protein
VSESLLLLCPTLFSLAMVSSHLARTSEPSSQIESVQLLAYASLFCDFSEVMLCLISDITVVLLSLSVYFSDRNAVLKLALLQVSVSISNLV